MLPLVAGYGLNLLVTPFIVLTLGMHDYGIWSVTGALAQYAALFDLGVSRSVTRFVALHHARGERPAERAVLGVALAITIALGCILIAVGSAVAFVFEGSLHTGSVGLARTLLCATAVILVTGMLARVVAAAAFGRGRMIAGNVGLAVQTGLVAVGGVIGLVVGPELSTFAIASAIGGVIGLVLVVVAVVVDEREFPVGRPTLAITRDVIAFGLKGQVLGVGDIVLFQSPKIILGIVIGPAAAGAYDLGSRLALGARAFGSIASVALTTHMTRRFADGGDGAVRDAYLPLVRLNCGVSIFAPFLLVATSFSAIPLWLGEPNDEVLCAAILLSVALTFNVATGVSTAATLAINRMRMLIWSAVASCVLALALAIPAGLLFGYVGVVAAAAMAVVLGVAVGVVLVHLALGVPIRSYLVNVLPGYAAAAAALVVSMPIGIVADPSTREAAILPFLLSAVLFTTIYVGIAGLLNTLPRVWGRRSD
ncbi:lipopolysaccharide biosynthesis protein [Gordonia sp. SL306]|uniref:lipopolysaccharide biosynthesis protein n=1 Tax=Gordonia sp. SL306 TaxID=2995145 RepID=UPI002D1E4312|nr:oligosaccharide flippase family protein [Gordonia sp. SL306]